MTRAIRLAAPIAAAALLAAGCQTLAPYGPATGPSSQGWTQQAIENDRWRVTYRGHGRPEAVSDYALLRAAELTLERGYDWFLVEQSWIDAGYPGGPRPNVSIGGGRADSGRYSASGVGVGLGLNLGGGEATVVSMEIRMGRGPQPPGGRPYDARDVAQSIRARL